MEKILIIGGNAAGLTAASRAKRIDPRLRITVLERSPHIAYSTCGVPYFLSGLVSADDLISYSPEAFERERGVAVHTHMSADAIEVGRKRVTAVRTDTGERAEFFYDRLLLATGMKTKMPDVPGVELQNVYSIATLQDAIQIREAMPSVKAVAIVGAGYVGLEMAECMHAAGKTVCLFEREPQVLPSVDPDMAQIIEYELRRFGVQVFTGARVLALTGKDDRVTGVKAASGLGVQPADMALVDTGAEPNVALARESGIEIGAAGGVSVNSCMETNVPGVYAAGNCAEAYCAIRRRPVLYNLGTVAAKQGRVAGENLAARRTEFYGALGTTIVKVFDLAVARTGLSGREARAESVPVVSARIETTDRAAYYPGAQRLWVKLIAERDSRKLVGAQIAGYGDAARGVNVAATAIAAGMRIDEIEQLDLAYAPPYGGLWDPILIAAQALMREL